MEEIRDFIVDYIQREYTIGEDVDILALNYVETGYVDSIGMIQFIATIEDEFGIAFTDEELENPNIKVVGKLIEIIHQKTKA